MTSPDRLERSDSFNSRYKPTFDVNLNQWVIRVPAEGMKPMPDGSYEVTLPAYLSRAMSIGGNILRPMRKEYRN